MIKSIKEAMEAMKIMFSTLILTAVIIGVPMIFISTLLDNESDICLQVAAGCMLLFEIIFLYVIILGEILESEYMRKNGGNKIWQQQ